MIIVTGLWLGGGWASWEFLGGQGPRVEGAGYEGRGSDNPNAHTGAQPEIFQGRESFVKLGHFDKHFIKKSRKKAPQGNIL